MMKTSLIAQAALKLSAGLLTIRLLLFLPAGIDYWNGWLLIILLFVPMLLVGSILWKKSPELLAKRLASNEQQRPQRQVILASLIMFVGGFLIAGFDFSLSLEPVANVCRCDCGTRVAAVLWHVCRSAARKCVSLQSG